VSQRILNLRYTSGGCQQSTVNRVCFKCPRITQGWMFTFYDCWPHRLSSDCGSGVKRPAAKSILIVSRAAPSVSSSWAIPVSRRFRSIDGLAPKLPVEEPLRNAINRVELSKPTIQRSRRQGVSRDVGATTPKIAGDKYDASWVANAVLLLQQIEIADAEETFLSIGTKVIHC
jgi:hypothetical protein